MLPSSRCVVVHTVPRSRRNPRRESNAMSHRFILALLALISCVAFSYSAAGAASPFATIPGNPIGVACIGDGPGGVTDQLIVMSYSPGNVHTVDENGVVTTLFVPGFPQNWSGIESYLALSTGLGGWASGQLYATFGPTVYQFALDLSSATPFVTIPGKPGTHTGITFDRTGVWGFDMIISFIDGTVYRVNSGGTLTFIASTSQFHESPRVVPDDIVKWGGFAGCITTSSESANQVFAICPGSPPSVGVLASGIPSAESSDIRPATGETTFGSTSFVYFGSRFAFGQIWGYPASDFPAGSAGDMFVSREFAGGITRVSGPGSVSTFEAAFGQHYEGSNFCFVAGVVETAEICDNGIDDDGDGLVDNADPDCQVCGDGNLDPGEQCDDSNLVSGDGCSSVCQLENQPPVCTAATANPSTLWPPNHAMIPISIAGVTDPNGDPVTITATSVSQDEPVKMTGTGSGNTSPDATLSPLTVRAERNGNPQSPGNGRVYHISFTADDGKGGTCSGTVTVCVPHDQRPGSTCVDGGPLFDSTVP